MCYACHEWGGFFATNFTNFHEGFGFVVIRVIRGGDWVFLPRISLIFTKGFDSWSDAASGDLGGRLRWLLRDQSPGMHDDAADHGGGFFFILPPLDACF